MSNDNLHLTRNKELLEHLQTTVSQLTSIIDNNLRIVNNNLMTLETLVADIKTDLKKDINTIKTGYILVFSEDREKTIQTLGRFDTKEKAYNNMRDSFKENEKISMDIFDSGLNEESAYIIFKNDRTLRWKIIDIMNPV